MNKPYRPTPATLTSLTFSELMAKEFPPPEFLLAPVIEKGSLSLVYGPAGLGKTWFTAGIAVAVAAGVPFLKWKADRPYRVLYIDGEMPGARMKQRLGAIAKALDADAATLGDNLHYLGRTTQPHDIPFPDFATKDGQTVVIENLKKIRPDLIVLDNLFTLCRSGDRNDAQSWDSMQDFLLDQRSRGRSVLVVHHANKANGFHGTSAQTVVMDSVVALKPPPEKSVRGARFLLEFEKSRNLVGAEAAPFLVDVIQSLEEPGEISGYECEMPEETLTETVVRLLRSGEYGNQTELAEAVGKDRSTVSKRLKAATAQGLITQTEIEACFGRTGTDAPVEARSEPLGDDDF